LFFARHLAVLQPEYPESALKREVSDMKLGKLKPCSKEEEKKAAI
jgi:hypothetical protein